MRITKQGSLAVSNLLCDFFVHVEVHSQKIIIYVITKVMKSSMSELTETWLKILLITKFER